MFVSNEFVLLDYQFPFRNTSGSAQNPAGNIPLIGGITGGIGKLFG